MDAQTWPPAPSGLVQPSSGGCGAADVWLLGSGRACTLEKARWQQRARRGQPARAPVPDTLLSSKGDVLHLDITGACGTPLLIVHEETVT